MIKDWPLSTSEGGQWPSGRASDSKSRGSGFDPHWHQVCLPIRLKNC